MSYPSFKLLEHVLIYFNRLNRLTPGSRKISGIKGSDRDKQNFYKDIERLEKILGRRIFVRAPGRGTEVTPEQEEILEQIGDIVDKVKALCDGTKPKICLKLATSQLLSLRVAGHLIEAFRNQVAETSNGRKPDVEITLESPLNLINSLLYKGLYDLILTVAPRNQDLDELLLGNAVIHRCILVKRDHEFVRFKEDIERGDIDLEMLIGYRVALVSDAERIPDFSREDVERYAKEIVVTNSTLESHAHVRVGTADLTFTHKDALSEYDMKNLCCIDLSHVKEHKLAGIRLCLLSGGRRRTDDNETQLLNQLKETLLTYFKGVDNRYEDADMLLKLFRTFRYTYHSSFIPHPVNGQPHRIWLRGKLDWEVHVPHLTPGIRPAYYYLGGTQTFSGPENVEPASLPMFGRVVNLDPDHENQSPIGGHSYLWRGSYFKDESGSFNVVFGYDDLTKSDYLFGTWSGTPAWIDNKKIQIAGCIIFHKSNSVDSASLNKIVQIQRANVRDVYGSKVNPQDPWQMPYDVSGPITPST